MNTELMAVIESLRQEAARLDQNIYASDSALELAISLRTIANTIAPTYVRLAREEAVQEELDHNEALESAYGPHGQD